MSDENNRLHDKLVEIVATNIYDCDLYEEVHHRYDNWISRYRGDRVFNARVSMIVIDLMKVVKLDEEVELKKGDN